MYKCCFLLLILFISCKSIGQVNGADNYRTFPYGQPVLNFATIEKQNDGLKAQFIKSPPAGFKAEYEAYSKNEFSNLDSLKKDIHVYDINGDGLDDIIFEGRSGSEATEVAFILNTPQGFKIIFKGNEHLIKFDTANKKITTIYIDDPGCCDAYIDFSKVYDFTYQNDVPKATLVYLTAYSESTDLPGNYFDKPTRFEVLDNGYKMRAEPVINDTTKRFATPDDTARVGNSVGVLPKGAKGWAIASQTDATGRVWWMVEMDPDIEIGKSIFYKTDDITMKARKMGWISSRYVKKLD
jgi:hypothetical protein